MANKIVYNNFVLYPSDNAVGRFDLWKKITRTKKNTDEEYEAEEDIGYGMTLNRCIEKISHIKVNETIGEELTLKQYVDKLIDELETIKRELL